MLWGGGWERECGGNNLTEGFLIYQVGYLGAGKTTLVNYVLREQHGQKIAVVLNGLYTLSGSYKAGPVSDYVSQNSVTVR